MSYVPVKGVRNDPFDESRVSINTYIYLPSHVHIGRILHTHTNHIVLITRVQNLLIYIYTCTCGPT